jgi:membrane-bound lytic murein transglycosylase D
MRRCAIFLASLLLAAPLLAEEEPVPIIVSDDPEVREFSTLGEAETLYDKALESFRNGKVYNARAEMKRAFALLTSLMDEDELPMELRADFHAMLEKVRVWEGHENSAERIGELEVAPDELASAETETVPSAKPKRPKSVEEALARSGRYRKMILKHLRRAKLPEELFWLVMTESEFKQKAISRSGAGGLWQFMPFTGRKYGLEVSYWVDERYDPEKATKAAVQYLTELYQWFGDWHLAMAAYNRGENGIGRDLKFSRSTDFSGLSKRGALPGETHNYVPKFMACVLIGENPERYGLKVEYEKPEAYDVVPIPKPLDLKIAAKAAGITERDLRRMNPELRAWCTPKNRKSYPLRVPAGIKDSFLERLSKVKDWNPGPQLVTYKVRRGDFLGKIARRYRTSVKAIMRLNGIRNPKRLRIGQKLKIRPGKSFYR